MCVPEGAQVTQCGVFEWTGTVHIRLTPIPNDPISLAAREKAEANRELSLTLFMQPWSSRERSGIRFSRLIESPGDWTVLEP
jgi:hypothetical protein